mgnify:CR=1 FL=1
MDKVFSAAIVHQACPACHKPVKSKDAIVINSKLTTHHAKKVEQMHDKCVGISKTLCDECLEELEKAHKQFPDKSYIKLIGIKNEDNAKTVKNPYLTGKYILMEENALKRMFGSHPAVDFAIENRWMYVDSKIVEDLTP